MFVPNSAAQQQLNTLNKVTIADVQPTHSWTKTSQWAAHLTKLIQHVEIKSLFIPDLD
jgi:hypothetical protein